MAVAALEVSYDLFPQQDGLEVEISITEHMEKKLSLIVPDLLGHEGKRKIEVTVDGKSYDISGWDFELPIKRKTDQPITVTYKIDKNEWIAPDQLYIANDKVFIHSAQALVQVWVDNDEEFMHNVKFFCQGKKSLHSSLGHSSNGSLRVSSNSSDFEQAFFALNFMAQKHGNVFIINDPAFQDAYIAKLTARANKMVRVIDTFFEGKKTKPAMPNYFVVIPIQDSWHSGGQFTAGSNAYNFFIKEFTNSASHDVLEMVLLHEYIHKYIAGTLKMTTSRQAWFFEGFTSYYTNLLGDKYNLMEEDSIIEDVNQKLKYYYSLNGDSLTSSDGGPSNGPFGELNYGLGMWFAYNLNEKIKSINADYDLDTFIKRYVALGRQPFEATQLLKDLDKEFNTKDEFFKFYRHFLSKPRKLDEYLPTEIWGIAHKCYKEEKIYQYDFNIISSITNMVVEGVRPGSKAYGMGLRNGQQILSASFDALDKIALTFEKGKTKQEIIIAPTHAIEKPIPQYCRI